MSDSSARSIANSITFALTIAYCGWIRKLGFTKPNKEDEKGKAGDTIGKYLTSNIILGFYGDGYFVFSILHALTSLLYPNVPSNICPHPEHLDPRNFAWSVKTIMLIFFTLVGGRIRLQAYEELGASFTYKLSKPANGLVKTGMYSYIQHPSYLGVSILAIASHTLLALPSGIMGCFLSASWMGSSLLWTALYIHPWVGMAVFLTVRVREEERFLKKALGKEWEEYHATTARLIPYIL